MLPNPTPALERGRVSLRPWEMCDLPLVEEAASDASLNRGTTLPDPYTPAAGAAFVERQWSRRTAGEGLSLAIAVDGRPVGCATLLLRRPGVADVGYWLVDRARGARTGSTAVGLLVEWALTRPEVEAVEAHVADDNAPSRRLLARLGFELAGRGRHRVNDLDDELLVYRRS